MTKFIIITTTSDDSDVLERISERLVTDRMVACCQIAQPIKSIYRWNGNVESSTEFDLKIKTIADRFDAVAEVIGSMHNYDVPQIVAVEMSNVSASYADWIRANVE